MGGHLYLGAVSTGNRNGSGELEHIWFVARGGSGMRQGQRLTAAERAELQRRLSVGETFLQAAAAAGAVRRLPASNTAPAGPHSLIFRA